ncbi:alpha/beta hydrolase [Streptomyces sp. NPDC047009]|uniref:alpha/beta hydrolase n=1 Tax=unclassified Streptomyces TaxID=2593676 RepID=UPI003404540A
MTYSPQDGPEGEQPQGSDIITGDLVFIHGFQDNAEPWQGVINHLECPGWVSIPVSLHQTVPPEPHRRGETLEAYRDHAQEELFDDERAQLAGKQPAYQLLNSLDPEVQAAYHSRAMAESDAHFSLPPSVEEPKHITLRSTRKAQMYEPDAWVTRVSPTPLLMVVGRTDTVTPTDLALAAYERALEPKRLRMFHGDHFDSCVAAFKPTSEAAAEWFCEHLAEPG